MATPRLIIPVEIKNREFDAKLLLALAAGRRGFRVVVGERYAVEHLAARLPQSLYLGKDITQPVAALYRRLRAYGHRVVALDEEALVYYTDQVYRQRRFHADTCRQADLLFAWGLDNSELWRRMPDFPATPIATTGNPRFDLFREAFRPLYGPAVAELRQRFGDFWLINSNFGHVNSFRADNVKMPDPDLVLKGEVAAPRSYDAGLARHRRALYQRFRDMVRHIAQTFPHRTLVLRPHPSEDVASWRQWLADCPNVHILYQGIVAPWLLASQLLIHNGCTTALEAHCLGIPALAYCPDRDSPFELKLPNRLSVGAPSLEALTAALETATKAGPEALGAAEDPQTTAERRAILDRHLAARHGALAAERIADQLAALDPSSPPPLAQRWRARAKGLYVAVKKARKRRWFEDPARRTWRHHLFPPTPREEVVRRLAGLTEGLGAEVPHRLKTVGPSVFELIPA
ncbi:MAG: surface carbohydrate biosynthesis protein [Candidatus Competibacterales bacterium]